VPEGNVSERGRDAIVAAVSGALTGTRTVHHGPMPEIEITGPDTARGVWAMFDYVEWPAAEGGERVGLRGYGHYLED
jgi:SnoaL-like protein